MYIQRKQQELYDYREQDDSQAVVLDYIINNAYYPAKPVNKIIPHLLSIPLCWVLRDGIVSALVEGMAF